MWLYVVAAVLVMASHYVADFVLQTRWMGDNKSKRILPLLAHGAAYTVGMFLFLLPTFYILSLIFPALSITALGVGIYCLCNGVLHTVIDFFSSRMTSRAWAEKKIGKFWKIIGADQLVHETKLLVSLGIFLAICII